MTDLELRLRRLAAIPGVDRAEAAVLSAAADAVNRIAAENDALRLRLASVLEVPAP